MNAGSIFGRLASFVDGPGPNFGACFPSLSKLTSRKNVLMGKQNERVSGVVYRWTAAADLQRFRDEGCVALAIQPCGSSAHANIPIILRPITKGRSLILWLRVGSIKKTVMVRNAMLLDKRQITLMRRIHKQFHEKLDPFQSPEGVELFPRHSELPKTTLEGTRIYQNRSISTKEALSRGIGAEMASHDNSFTEFLLRNIDPQQLYVFSFGEPNDSGSKVTHKSASKTRYWCSVRKDEGLL
jgi:hypothetical protein